jgi:cell division protein FtsA
MAKGDILIGLEIGTSKVCVAVGEADAEGPIKILGIGEAPSRGVRKGEIVDFENAVKCVREAVADAEEKCDVEIRSVFVGVSGSHIHSFNNRGCVHLPEDREEIDEEDYQDVAINAQEVNIPQPNTILHHILQHYYVDGQDGVLNPIGMYGRKLEADFHVIHGVRNRIKNTIRCVSELGLQVEDVVFNGLASAQVVLTQEQKDVGAMVIDLGGGTADYMVYVDGAVKQSGVLGIGGDHLTNDLSLGLRVPIATAERLKIEYGSALVGTTEPGETITLQDETGFVGRDVDRETLNTIIHLRLRETFEAIKRALDEEPFLPFLGAGMVITGGSSHLHGITALAEEIFGIPVRLGSAQSTAGVKSASENPRYATAIGLLRYGQATLATRPRATGITKLFKSFFGFK